ncbi:MAG: hypothetical protein MI742_06355 [Desulfobacterales bacterium]|nr:hypothetical protein [Desulfobacterales bacterium]
MDGKRECRSRGCLALWCWMFVVLCLATPALAAQPSEAHGFLSGVTRKLLLLQFELRQQMTEAVRLFGQEGGVSAFLSMGVMAFVYGVVHAAGPGHGKAVASAFMLHGDRRLKEGLLFGNLVAFAHGLSGIVTVFFLKWVLDLRFSKGLKAATQMTSQVSFFLIIVLGGFLMITGIKGLLKPSEKRNPSSKPASFTAALAFGMVPCPGVVMVLLFAMGVKQFPLGVGLALCITCGMAVTISATTFFVVLGKRGASQGKERKTKNLSHLFTFASGLFLSLIGLFLFL